MSTFCQQLDKVSSQKSEKIKGAIFSYCDSDHPVDLLDSAAAVTCFLSEAAVHFSADKIDNGLSVQGCNGLVQILHGIENTINLAIERL